MKIAVAYIFWNMPYGILFIEVMSMTRAELCGFIGYIRGKENVVIDPYITRTCFKPRVDKTDYVCSLVKIIKGAMTDEEAYEKLALNLGGGLVNSEHKLFPSVCYFEDMYDCLTESGLSNEDADKLTRIIAGGGYKAFCRQNPRKERLSGDLHKFALACKCLPHRDAFAKLLHTEYDNFQKSV